MSTLLFQNTAGFELNDGWRISSVLVDVLRLCSRAEDRVRGQSERLCLNVLSDTQSGCLARFGVITKRSLCRTALSSKASNVF
jgi:hypothetical protein